MIDIYKQWWRSQPLPIKMGFLVVGLLAGVLLIMYGIKGYIYK
jgi:hypothetical protein